MSNQPSSLSPEVFANENKGLSTPTEDNIPDESPVSPEVHANRIATKIIAVSTLGRVLVILILLYVVIGSFFFPYWWYVFLMKGGLFSTRHWEWGLGYVKDNLLFPAVITAALLALVYLLSPENWKTQVKSYFGSITTPGARKKIRLAELLLITLLVASLLTLSSRSAQDPARFSDEVKIDRLLAQRPNDVTQDKWMRELLGPTTFLYLSKEGVDSLYGQYEPDLIPASVIEEMKDSNQVKAGLKLESFLTTEAGKEELKRKLTEYKQTAKSHERKFKELLQFLLEKDSVRRYGSIRESSPEVDELDRAISVLSRKYNISVDSKQLLAVRDRLLSQQMERLVSELSSLKGLALVDGKWNIEKQTDAFVLRRPFIDNVTDPPICEIKIRKSDLTEPNRETIEGLNGEPITLKVFGNVLTGMGTSRVVHVNPIAVF